MVWYGIICGRIPVFPNHDGSMFAECSPGDRARTHWTCEVPKAGAPSHTYNPYPTKAHYFVGSLYILYRAPYLEATIMWVLVGIGNIEAPKQGRLIFGNPHQHQEELPQVHLEFG